MVILACDIAYVAQFFKIDGALIQLAFIHRMEDSLDRESSFSGKHASLAGNKHPLARGISHWGYDKEAVALRIGYVKPEIISWKPRIILFHNFLSAEECDYLRSVAMPRLHVSTVVDAKTGKVCTLCK
uniref:Prolyl 4-hydroxylase 1-like isoform X2 n=1 Tax=Nicotiana sylvestris TaxID=4096 RepID=A0A1U7W7M3_NICSY|nr:PREDICTED: prolyl 4-hydroxylase 1-like isoform X2 [Nicotiana sylvestris]